LMITNLTVELSVLLICISFRTKDVEHCFMYLLAICISSSENCIHLSIY
jgi:hypothetical protein